MIIKKSQNVHPKFQTRHASFQRRRGMHSICSSKAPFEWRVKGELPKARPWPAVAWTLAPRPACGDAALGCGAWPAMGGAAAADRPRRHEGRRRKEPGRMRAAARCSLWARLRQRNAGGGAACGSELRRTSMATARDRGYSGRETAGRGWKSGGEGGGGAGEGSHRANWRRRGCGRRRTELGSARAGIREKGEREGNGAERRGASPRRPWLHAVVAHLPAPVRFSTRRPPLPFSPPVLL
jgi:hypothetical protein